MNNQPDIISESSDWFSAMIAPRRVAFVGASDNPSRIGGRALHYTRMNGFEGELIPVNTKRREVQGIKAYSSLDEVSGEVDLAILSVPGRDVAEAVRAAARKQAKVALIYASGFAEVGPQGQALQDELVNIASECGIRLIGPNCVGFINCRNGLAATFSGSAMTQPERAGGLTIVSQSGAFGAHTYIAAVKAGAQPGLLLTTGNEADLNTATFIHMAALDAETEVIGVYAEGVKNGPELVAALDAAQAARKPVVVLKAGKSDVGSAAAAAHTAALAGEDRAFDAILQRSGAVRVESHEHLIDVALAARQRIYPTGNRLGIISVSGGGGIILADAAVERGLRVPELPESKQLLLKKHISFSSMRNPLDVTAQVANDHSIIEPAAKALLEENFSDAVIGYWGSSGTTPETLAPLISAVQDGIRELPPRLVLHSAACNDVMRQKFNDLGLTVFDDPVRTVRAMATMMEIGSAFSATKSPEDSRPRVLEIDLPQNAISEATAKEILGAVGVPFLQNKVCSTPEDAENAAKIIGGRVALKILSPDILHKSDIGGVALNVASDRVATEAAEMFALVARAAPRARIDGVLVSAMAPDGIDCIAGIRRDPVFGPMIVFGLGGIFTEIIADVSIRPAPLSHATALEMIDSLKAVALLRGARGYKPANETVLADVLVCLSDFALAAGERLTSAEINPLRIMPDGSPLGLDALISIEASDKHC